MRYPRRACPVCGCLDNRSIFHQEFSHLSSGSLLDGYDVVSCQACGFCFADDIPDQTAFDAYYRDMSKYEHQHRNGQESSFDHVRFQKTAELINESVTSDTTVLDIGCATGGLLSQLKARGFEHVLGLDPSPACAEAANRLYGIRVINTTVSALSELDQTFELLIMVGVLEHLHDLHGSLAELRGILPLNGRVYVEVPDVSQFIRWPNAPFQQFSIEHINFFSADSLENLMRANGFARVSSQQRVHEWNYGTHDPVVAAIFKRDDLFIQPIGREAETEKKLIAYSQQCQEVENRVRQVIDEVALSGEAIIVWGTGTHTLRLMAISQLANARINAFVDSNPRYQGKSLNGVPVIGPADMKGRLEPILVSSWVYQQEIVKQIRLDLQAKNRLILLYQHE